MTAARQTWLCTGHVVREDATPAAQAVAWVAWGTAPTPEIAFRTDDDGIFRVALPSGRFRVEASSPDKATGSVELTIGEEAITFEIVLMRPATQPGESGPGQAKT